MVECGHAMIVELNAVLFSRFLVAIFKITYHFAIQPSLVKFQPINAAIFKFIRNAQSAILCYTNMEIFSAHYTLVDCEFFVR